MQIRASQASLHTMQTHAKTHAEMYAWLHPLVQAELSVAAIGPLRVCCAPNTDKCYHGCCCISTSLRVSDQSFQFAYYAPSTVSQHMAHRTNEALGQGCRSGMRFANASMRGERDPFPGTSHCSWPGHNSRIML
jgi:hypothetical protein